MKQILLLVLMVLIISRSLWPVPLLAQEPLSGSISPSTSSSAITLTSFSDPYPTEAKAFALETPQETIEAWFDDLPVYFTGYDALGNPYDMMRSTWSWDAVDTGTPGVYYAFAEPHFDTHYTLLDGVSLPQQRYAISIQEPGKLDLNCLAPGRGSLYFPWFFSPEQVDQFEVLRKLEQADSFGTVWLRQDLEDWTQLKDGFIFVSDALHLSDNIFDYGSTYSLQVDYSGGQTGVLTFQYTWPLNVVNYSEGDRDGGDVNSGDSPSGSQAAPAPKPPKVPSHILEDIQEDILQDVQEDILEDVQEDILEDVQEEDKPEPEPNTTTDESISARKKTQAVKPTPTLNVPDLLDKIGPISLVPLTKLLPAYAHIPPALESEDLVPKPGTKNLEELPVIKEANPVAAVVTKSPEAIPATQAPDALKPEALEPKPPILATPRPEETVVLESYSPGQTVISALRLRDLCAEEANVVFGSGNLTISIPSKLLSELNLSDSDTLSVSLSQAENTQITLAIEAAGQSVTDIPGAVLRLAYMPLSESTEITIRHETGGEITDTSFDNNLLSFMVHTTGIYNLLEIPQNTQTQKATFPVFPVFSLMVLALGGITLFRRKGNG